MMESYAHVEQKLYSDGKMIENKDIEMNYDGEKMAIDVVDNGHKRHIVLSKDDIMKVFTQPMHSSNLMARLQLDFKPTKYAKKHTTKKHAKTKKTAKHSKKTTKHAKTKKTAKK
jgi:hypothetical protein